MFLQLYKMKFYPNEITVTNVEFESLTAVVMKSSIFWVIMLCSPLKLQGIISQLFKTA
jgi:hypothetical protein